MGAYKNMKNDKKGASAGSTKAKSGKVPFSDYRFINIELTTDEKEDFKEWLPDCDPTDVLLRNLCSEGAKLSFSTGDNGNTAICSLSITDATDVNAGGVLTGRGRAADTALAVLCYKLHLIGERTWAQAEHERGGSTASDIG